MKRTIGLLFSVLLIAGSGFAQETEGQRLVVPLSDPARPVTLHASLISGGITVRGQQGQQEVVVVARPRLARMTEHPQESAGGMRRIPNTSMGVTVEEDNNTVSVSTDWTNRTVDLEITVPVRSSLQLSVINDAKIEIDGVQGDLELQNVNGPITALNIRGSVVANTTNGPVRVTFVEVTPDKPMSFATFNGDVDVTFPAGVRANLRMQPGQGDVYTDLDVKIEPRAPVVERNEDGGRFTIRVEQEVRGTLGGGGPEFSFKTFNGDIYLRRVGS